MTWRKLGLIFNADGRAEWMHSHAANPVAEHRGGNEFRIYFGSRDRDNRAHIVFVDVELQPAGARVVGVCDEPVLKPGPLGAFDDSGTSMGCLIPDGDRMLLYYLGWNLGVTVPWRNSIGLAIRQGRDGQFERVSPAPVMDRSAADPFTISYPCVLREGRLWRMWYGSNLSWGVAERDMNHVIKYAESDDGIHWRRDGAIAIDLRAPEEYALCRPWVLRSEMGYRMWFCHRGAAYRLGLAQSNDGYQWRRCDESVGLDVSSDGWDAEMIAYPSLIRHEGREYLFYNGNRYGKTGFGVAVREAAA